MPTAAGDPGEEGRLIAEIETLWEGRSNPGLVLAGGDDCAIVQPPTAGVELLLATDQIVEGRHFLPDKHPPAALGRKALARSLSDIAAMGGRPLYFLQALCLPQWALGSWHRAFQRGMRELAADSQLDALSLAGGDVSGGERFVATLTVVGCVEQGTAMRRSGAQPGDRVYLSGSVGGSAMGLEMLLGETTADWEHPAIRRHCEPRPRLELGRALRSLPASAAIDLSDGLATDANRLAAASGAAVFLEGSSLPLFPGTRLENAVRSGEEYELLFTLPPGPEPPRGFDTTEIGRVDSGTGVWLDGSQGRSRLGPEGFSHF